MSTPPASFSKVTLGLSVMVVMSVLAVVVFLFSGLGESDTRMGVGSDVPLVEIVGAQGTPFVSGATFSTDDKQEITFLFDGGDVIRLYPTSELVFDEIDLEVSPLRLKAHLVSGEMWVSDLQGVIAPEIRSTRVSIEPRASSVFFGVYDSEVTVFAAHHPTRVQFLSNDDKREVLNDYVLTESHRVQIKESVLSELVGELRYTKLTKEYPFVYLKREEWDKRWVSALQFDLDRLSELYQAFSSDLRRTGRAGVESGSFGYRVEGVYRQFRSWLTLDKSYLDRTESMDDYSLLTQALYLILDHRDSEALERLNRFHIAGLNGSSAEAFADLMRVFRSVLWGSDFYPVKNLLQESLLASAPAGEKIEMELHFLRDRLNEVYDLLDLGERGKAREALIDYNRAWELFIEAHRGELAPWVQPLTEERQILQNLIFREDVFYSLESYRVLSMFEQNILNLTAKEYDLNEERLAFVQDKIRLLTRLVALVDEDVVGVKSGLALGRHMLTESRSLMNAVTSDVAVTTYFMQRLEELGRQLDFMASPEFKFGSGSFSERFSDYLAKEASLKELSVYVSGLPGSEVVVASGFEDALAEAQGALRSAQIEFEALTLIPRTPQDNRLFKIVGGRVGTVTFAGNYDRLTRIIYDLSVDGEAFSSGVNLKNFVNVVTETLAPEEEIVEEVVSTAVLSPVEKLAVDLARQNLQASPAFPMTVRTVSVVSVEDHLFQVVVSVPTRYGLFEVEFVYNMHTGEIMEVVATGTEGVVEVDSTILPQLKAALEDKIAHKAL